MTTILVHLVLRHLRRPVVDHRGRCPEGVQLAAIPWAHRRSLSTDTDYSEEVDLINELFVEARDEIDYAKEDAETVYFNESAQEARTAVGRVLSKWELLLQKVPAEERSKLQRSLGLKIEQLKAELQQLENLHT